MSDADTAPLVVAGVDGSPEAMVALEFAIEEARLRRAKLRVIYAYAVVSTLTGSTGEELYPQLEASARSVLEHVAESAPSTEGVDVSWVAEPGNPAEVLIEASKEATLLVVGSRGIGGFRGLVVGSVSTQCVHHANCPVLVVRKEH
jgi:nucleotide-binding universal stress UspA family protein